MSENKFKEYILGTKELVADITEQINEKLGVLSDVLNENMFISGYENLFNEGLRTYARKRYKRAIFYFEKANSEKRDNFNCLYNLALAYQADNDFEQAINYYTQAINLNPKDLDTIYNLGLCYLNQRNAELAEKYLKQAYSANPDETETKMSYILSIIECNNIDEAISMTIELVKSNKNYLDFALTAAKYIESMSFGEKDCANINKAIKLLNSYLKVNGSSSIAHMQASRCYGKIGNWDMALEHSLKALKLDSKSYEINFHTGMVLYCSHNYKEALKYYEKALFLSPKKNFEPHYNIALTYEKLNQISNLTKKVNYIIKHFGNHPQINTVQNILLNIEKKKSEQQNETTGEQEAEPSKSEQPLV